MFAPKLVALTVLFLAATHVAIAEERDLDEQVNLGVRGGIGAGARNIGAAGDPTRLAGELGFLGILGLSPYANRGVLLPEVTGAILSADRSRDYYLALGLGVGYASPDVMVGVVPSFVAGLYGTSDGSITPGFGARAMLRAELTGLFGVQGGVSAVSANGELVTEVRVLGTVDLETWTNAAAMMVAGLFVAPEGGVPGTAN